MPSKLPITKGHWPKGRPRSGADPARVNSALDELRRVLAHPRRGVRSLRQAARVSGVDARSVRRWLDGTHRPMSYHLTLLTRWCRHQWREIKRGGS